MDPNACLRRINSLTGLVSKRELNEACDDLHTWIARGGFHPDWTAYPTGTAYYRKRYGLGDDVRS